MALSERKNRTLIEAAKTMLADSLLLIPFWAEAVNTAWYVQNRVLVTKPHNKTPYELLHGRTPSIGFMRPFGCPVTILNTLDPLGKFKGKVDEGFLVGYSVNSSSPTWLFVIDGLTRTMNYQPITAGNQSNPSVGFQDKFDAKKAGEVVTQQYVLFPMWSSGSINPQNNDEDAAFDEKEHDAKKPESEVNVSLSSSAQSKKQDDKTKKKAKGKSFVESFTGNRDLSAEFEDHSNNNSNDVNAAGSIVPAVGQNSSNSTNPFSAEMEDITYSDHENVGAEADFNNLETSIAVNPIPTIRIHKNHLVSQIIGDLSLTTQTRKPKRVHQALKDPSWIEAIQEELLQFKMQKVWIVVDLPHGKREIGTKWVYRNKKDKRGIVVRNKARLVAQGHTQEEGIDYEEVFVPIARIEAIRLFLAYASFMGFMVYQMNVKSAFLYGTIEEEVYVCQPPGFKDPDHPDKVYKVVKARYGLHQATRAWYETLANYLLENGFHRGKIDQTLFIKKQKGDILLVQIYVKQKKEGIFISQDKYVAKILKKFGLTEGKSARFKDPDHPDRVYKVVKARYGLHQATRAWLQALVDKKKVAITEAAIRDEALDACATLIRRVEHLEHDKVAQALEITKLKKRVKKLKRANKGRMIADLDRDTCVALMDDEGTKKKAEDAYVAGDEQVKGRQVKIYQIDIDHASKEVVAVVSESVSAASATIAAVPAATITAAPVRVAAASTKKRKGVVIRDPKEESTAKTLAETKSKDKGKGIMSKEKIKEEENRAIESIKETLAQKVAKRRKLNEEVEDLKQHLEIVPDEDDDMYTKATLLARKVPVVDYVIVYFNNKPHYKIIRADGTHHLYVSFITLLKNFDREDLESLWSLVKETFSTSKPNNFSDDYLLTTLGAMFERPDGQAQLILLVERRYPLSRFTLDQMLNAVRLRVEEQSEMSLELLRLRVEEQSEMSLELIRVKHPKSKDLSLNKKSYCLVVTDDYSRFTWVFFLATMNETSPILKTFITGLKNQLSLKVKIIRSDNGTEFKNNDLNQFCGMKEIKKEFTVPRTPQQNGITERKNRTLIEAARTMLADLLLLILFWAEVVNTACYVQNRVLLTKPQNKTLYELLHGRTPSIGFMRPFGCPVTILNILDSLGKFDGKVDEGFLVGYSVSSKAFRVFNSRTRIVQETLHVNFLENKPNVASRGEEIEQQYVLFHVWSFGSIKPQKTNGDAAFDEKEPEFEGRKPESEVNVSPSSSAQSKKHDDKTKREAKGKIKRIFRYLKGKPHLGLWYLKDSPFDLVADSDSDYAGASLDRKSTTRGCQFLECRLIS
nr:hypothetical protein [Tanacetum cinerariifolium]